MQDRWVPESAEMVVGVPWRMSDDDPKADGEQLDVLKLPEGVIMQECEVMEEPMPRRFKITKIDLLEHGFTLRCRGCTAALKNTRPQGHSEACRVRFEMALDGSDKVKVAAQRGKEFIAKAMEKDDVNQRKRKAAESNGDRFDAENDDEQNTLISKDQNYNLSDAQRPKGSHKSLNCAFSVGAVRDPMRQLIDFYDGLGDRHAEIPVLIGNKWSS